LLKDVRKRIFISWRRGRSLGFDNRFLVKGLTMSALAIIVKK
jgi:hypothetical protein